MPARPCRPTRPRPLLGADDALEVVFLAADPDRHQLVLLPLDRRHVGGRCIVVDDVADPVRALELAVTAAVSARAEAVVVASVRPSGRIDVDDLVRWEVLRDALAAEGIRALDWFVVQDDRAASLRELNADPDPWTPPAAPWA